MSQAQTTARIPESTFFFDSKYLRDLALSHEKSYAQAQPFPHAVFDDFLPVEVAERLLSEFPAFDKDKWNNYNELFVRAGKYESLSELQLSPFIRCFLYHLNSSTFLNFLELLSGINGLIPDPEIGKTLRHYVRGGYLAVHTDFNWHRKLKLHRRLNVILYMNKDWKPEYGGNLELWDPSMKFCVKKIAPLYNRCVIFTTTDTSYHGLPDPLNCPEGVTRKTFQLYYYTQEISPRDDLKPHSSVFQPRPQDSWGKYRMVYAFMKKCTPPIVIDIIRRFLRR